MDEDQFKQILLNLVSNAIDAVENGEGPKRITVPAFARGNRAIVEVEDTGPGFKDLNRALGPFCTTKSVRKGTGLGLICYGFIKEHDGEIRLANLQPHGARVTVELPLGEAKELSNAAKAATGSVRDTITHSLQNPQRTHQPTSTSRNPL